MCVLTGESAAKLMNLRGSCNLGYVPLGSYPQHPITNHPIKTNISPEVHRQFGYLSAQGDAIVRLHAGNSQEEATRAQSSYAAGTAGIHAGSQEDITTELAASCADLLSAAQWQ